MSEAIEARRSRLPWATLSVALACTVVFVISWAGSSFVLWEDAGRLDAELLRRYGALDWLALREGGQWWRLVSAPFLHGAWWHLAFNLWALFVLGGSVERGAGVGRWAIVLFASGLSSGLAAMAWGRADMVVGVSGVVFGFGGFLVGSGVRARLGGFDNETPGGTGGRNSEFSISDQSPGRDASAVPIGELSFWLGLSLVAGWFWPELSQAGHVGGLVSGICLGVAPPTRRGLIVTTVLWAGASGWAVVEVEATPESAEAHERLGYALLNRDRPGEAWASFDRALGLVERADSRRGEWLNASAYARALGSEDPHQWRAGLELVEESLAMDPDDANRLDTKGWLLCRVGEWESGLETLRQAAVLSPDGPSEELREHLEACRRR